MDEGPSWLLVAATSLLDLGLAAVCGSLASLAWLRGARSAWADEGRRRARGALLASGVGVAVAAMATLCAQAAAMAGVTLAEVGPELGPVLRATQIGHAWSMAAPCLLLVLVAGFAALRGGGIAIPAAALGALGVIACRAAASHAAIHGPLSIAVVVEAIHLALTSLWIGAVLAASLLFAARSIDSAARPDAAAWVQRLSTTATVALAGIVATGLFNAYRGLDSPSEIVSTPWGRLLALKLVLVAGAVALGGWNRMVVMPVLLPAMDLGPMRRLQRIVRIEALLLVAALIVAVLLSNTAPGAAT